MNRSTPNLTDIQLNRLIQSCGDFQQALSALTFLIEECDYALRYSTTELRKFKCYENAAIVAFARPFEVSRGRTVLGLRALGIQLNPAEVQLKKKVLDLRRKVVAHSDDERMHFKISTMQVFQDSPLAFPVLLFEESLHLNQTEAKELHELLHKFARELALTIFALAQSQPERLNIYKLPSNY
jgi:hypothetical protein